MSLSKFLVRTHTFPGQHVRHYPGATRHKEKDTLYLEAKQYVPLKNIAPKDGDITILAAHAVSFPKELYEPLWDDLLDQSDRLGFRIRSIWIADASNHGASGILNEHTQGDDPSFFDYPRDLLHMVNLFRDEFPQPIIGIGHSMGGTALVQLALMHPRLLASLVLLDPIIGLSSTVDYASMFYLTSVRNDLWASHEEAKAACRKIFRTWDPRVFGLWTEHGIRETPTAVHPGSGKVTLRTTKAQEAWSYGRNWFDLLPADGGYATPRSRAKYPDMNLTVLISHPFYRGEDFQVWQDLPRVRPGVIYVLPDGGPKSDRRSHAEMAERTGTGAGGSGGVPEGRVDTAVVNKAGHLLPFERPTTCATIAAAWIVKEVKAWRERCVLEREQRDDKSINKVALSEEWVRQAKMFYQKAKLRAKL